jgi:tetratricopeptide (TPR) repeat protein
VTVKSPESGANSLALGIDDRARAEPRALVLCSANARDPDAVLELAGEHYRRGDFSKANACAQLATDLVPQAVEAQHLRAAALIGLSRYDEAQVAFAMALVLDPDDPETLADVADFFINILPPKRRHTVEVGLQYARRGGQGAVARRRPDRKLQGRLLLLEAEALNDLGDPEGALVRAEEALQLVPELTRAKHELAVSHFNLLRFEESEGIFLRLLSRTPSDAYAHHHLGLIYEHRGRVDDAEAHFQRARELAPDDFWSPVILSKQDFAAEVDSAIAELPEALADLVKAVELELADVPALADLQASNPPFTPTILGLYRGLPAGVSVEPTQGKTGAPAAARTLILYRKNLGRTVHNLTELRLQIRRTLRHEVGHIQGYNEDQLRRLGLE